MSELITCGLAENALDYLILAGEQAKDGSPRMTKHALAALADGVELLLKARLEMRDWCLIFKDVDQASRPKYECGDFQSVVFDQAIGRLKNLCSVEIPSKHLAVINELRQLRNRIRHFAVNSDRAVAISIITKTFSFAIEFVSEHLEQVSDGVRMEMDRLRLFLGEYEEFIQERRNHIQPQIAEKFEKHRPGLECPKCLQLDYYGNDKFAHCLFCGYRCEAEAAAEEWVEKFESVHGNLPQIVTCPKCGANACVEEGDSDTTFDVCYVCLSCGESGFEACPACGKVHGDENREGLCRECWQHHFPATPMK
ncbi:MAG: hypothetical protein HYX68_14005 [Planctomycetes bacterium]|nr:hypothetical protein [Planctomycetota bacterium]